jgi:hypothetical protein
VRRWPGIARTWARLQRGREQEVSDGGLTGEVRGQAREDVREKKRCRQIGPTGSEREREREKNMGAG